MTCTTEDKKRWYRYVSALNGDCWITGIKVAPLNQLRRFARFACHYARLAEAE